MSVLGIGALVASALVIGSVILPAAIDRHDEAEALTAATDATARKAGDMATRFGDIVPDRAEGGEHGEADHPSETSRETHPSERAAEHGSDDTDHAVAAALRELAALDIRTGGINGDERVIAVENLRDAWEPRYRQAEEEHRRLTLRVEHADRAAGRYFEVQADLTGQIRDPEARLRAERGDRAEREMYRRWREQAGRTMAQADLIMVDLRDMDIRITKQLLSANFASVYRDFQEVPAAIDALHRDLERFRARSEEISVAFNADAR